MGLSVNKKLMINRKAFSSLAYGLLTNALLIKPIYNTYIYI